MFTLVEQWQVAPKTPGRLFPVFAPSLFGRLPAGRLDGRWAGGAAAVAAHLSFLLILLSMTSPVAHRLRDASRGAATFEARMIEEGANDTSTSQVDSSATSSSVGEPAQMLPSPAMTRPQPEWTRLSVLSSVELPSNAMPAAEQQRATAPAAGIGQTGSSGYDPYASASIASASLPAARPASLPECPCSTNVSDAAPSGCAPPNRPPCPAGN